jgi:hypothetical protein
LKFCLPATIGHPSGPIFLRFATCPRGRGGYSQSPYVGRVPHRGRRPVARTNTVKAQYCTLSKYRIENSVCRHPWGPIFLRHPYRPAKGARVWWPTGAHHSRRPNNVREVPACIGPCVSARLGRHSAFRGRPAVGGGAASRPKMTHLGSGACIARHAAQHQVPWS